MRLISTRRQTLDDGFSLGADKVRDRIASSGHAGITREAILARRQGDAMDGRFEGVVAPSHHEIADVHDEGILQGRHVHEFAWFVGFFDLNERQSGGETSSTFDLRERQPAIPRTHPGKAT